MNRYILRVALTIAFCAAGATAPQAATANTVVITSCGAAPAGAADDAWQPVGSSGTIASSRHCPPTPGGFDENGLALNDVFSPTTSDTAPGQLRSFAFQAPPETTITAVSWLLHINKFDEDWTPFTATGDGTLLDTCHIAGGAGACFVGDGYFGEDGDTRISHSGLSTTALEVGLRCDAPIGRVCLNGATQSEADVELYSSSVTLSDVTLPVVTDVGGAPLDGAPWHQGIESASLSATDALGIKTLRTYADGQLLGESSQLCDFSRRMPCPNATSAAAPLDTARLSDGTHAIALAAVDAAGNEQRSSAVNIGVDNHAPDAPVNLQADVGSEYQPNGTANLAWMLPAQGQGSPITKARVRLCSSGGCTASSATSSLTAARLQLPAPGSYTAQVTLTDAAGEGIPASVPLRYDPSAPVVAITSATPTGQTATRAFSVSYVATPGGPAPIGWVHWTLCNAAGCPLQGDTNGGILAGTLPSAGTWTLTLTATSAAGVGSAPAAATLAAKPEAPKRIRPRFRLTVRKSHGRLVIVASLPANVRGRVKLAVRVSSAHHKPVVKKMTTALRHGKASFRSRLPRGARGVVVTAVFGGDSRYLAARARARVR